MSDNETNVDNIFSSFRVKVLKTKFLPSTMDEMDVIIRTKAGWEKLQNQLEFFYEWILLASFVSVFLKSQIITGLFIALVGGISRTITNCKAKREELTNQLNVYIKRFGFDSLVFDESDLANNQSAVDESHQILNQHVIDISSQSNILETKESDLKV